MRVLVLWTSLARSSEGGYTFARGLTRALVDSGDIQLTLVLPATVDRSFLDDGGTGVDIVSVRARTGLIRLVRDLVLLPWWTKRTGVDLVVVPHEWASWGAGTPVVSVIQNVLYLTTAGRQSHPFKTWLMRSVAKATARLSVGSIAVSPSAAHLWEQTTGRRSIVIPEGVHSSFIERAEHRVPGSIVIITGNEHHKNPTFARALYSSLRLRTPRSSISLIGLPPEAGEEITARVEHVELATRFARADLVVLTSTTESFGLPAFEARASGCDLVVAAGTPMADWLGEDPQVTVVPDLDVATWIEVCLQVAHRNGRKVSDDRFGWDDVRGAWVEALRTLASGADSGAR